MARAASLCFSVRRARDELLRYGKEHYRSRSKETSTLLYELFRAYQEDPDMATCRKNSSARALTNCLKKLPARNAEGLTPEGAAGGLTPEELRATLEDGRATAAGQWLIPQGNGPSSKPQ
jgi:hypothetical protein